MPNDCSYTLLHFNVPAKQLGWELFFDDHNAVTASPDGTSCAPILTAAGQIQVGQEKGFKADQYDLKGNDPQAILPFVPNTLWEDDKRIYGVHLHF